MKVAIDARVSTANNGQNPATQTRELREYAERRGWIVAGQYVDVGISGTKEKRPPELERLMSDAHRRRFDAVVVWKFDRFAHSVSTCFEHLRRSEYKVSNSCLSPSTDTSSPAGKMVFTVLGAVAELERGLIVERVKAGLRNARAKGRRLGRPKVSIELQTGVQLSPN